MNCKICGHLYRPLQSGLYCDECSAAINAIKKVTDTPAEILKRLIELGWECETVDDRLREYNSRNKVWSK